MDRLLDDQTLRDASIRKVLAQNLNETKWNIRPKAEYWILWCEMAYNSKIVNLLWVLTKSTAFQNAGGKLRWATQ